MSIFPIKIEKDQESMVHVTATQINAACYHIILHATLLSLVK